MNLTSLSIIQRDFPPTKVFAYATKYWQITTTLASYNLDFTFDLTGEVLGPQENWRVYRRENEDAPWVEWTGLYQTLPGNKIKVFGVTELSDWTVGTLVDPTLPVELASFSASVNAQNLVQIDWITHSETNLVGFNLFRNESDQSSNALMINTGIIQPHNTSSTSAYSFTDKEVQPGAVYYYWLQSVEMDGQNELYGPVSIMVDENTVPELPQISTMSSAYPNPFRTNEITNIDVSLKQNETGTVTIYNLKGQALKSYPLGHGNHRVQWDGKDRDGSLCGSGIYLYRLNTSSVIKTGKVVIVK